MTLARRSKSIHARGDCAEHDEHGNPCDGIAAWTTDPFLQEVHDETAWGWWCPGSHYAAYLET